MIAHGSGLPARRRSASDIPLFVGWFNDARTSRTLAAGRADVDRRWRRPGSCGSSRTRAGTATTSRSACSRTTGRSARSGCSSWTCATATPASGSRSATPRTRARAPAATRSRAARRLGVRHAPARADLARRVRPSTRAARRRLRARGFVHEGTLRRSALSAHGGIRDVAPRCAIPLDEWRARRLHRRPDPVGQPSATSRRLSALSSRSSASRNGSVTSGGSASRTESLGP